MIRFTMLLLTLLLLWARKRFPLAIYPPRIATISFVFVVMALPLRNSVTVHGAERDTPWNQHREQQSLVAAAAAADANRLRPKKMREGTLVPPTTGRFVAAGRRWMFITDEADGHEDDLVSRSGVRYPWPENVFRSTSTRDQASPGMNLAEGERFGNQRNHLREPSTHAAPQSDPMQLVSTVDIHGIDSNQKNPLGLSQIVAVENLMLQRIVEAIRVDGADDRWIVSGRLTEYFDENRLQIRTAERAASK